MSNHTYKLVDLPKSFTPISNKYVFRKKLKLDGSIQKYKMDVKKAFLNGDLDDEIYMEQPSGFITPDMEDKVCILGKSLYGLKQAPKQWYKKFHKIILSFSFLMHVYSNMFGFDCVIISLYVDDMLISNSNIQDINKTMNFLSTKFEMIDLGEYAKIIGSLMFLMNYTQPDITYAVSRLSKYTHNPNNEHWNALKYNNFGVRFYRIPYNSKSEFYKWVRFYFGKSNYFLETCIARSTIESDFIALDLAGQEAEWLRNLLTEILLWEKQKPLVSLLCDLQAAICVAKS
ncbi:Retrovirus-related Pol polyprotein from transposon TNT 1-94 [Gossypium australe]|uniref:Retrovirus-related Pol polyprotein from transposon TNT 1-94 n=1 Tax=Gossypium australe TaxID=47621 RepID=A0A5B6WIL5_9ROSI|nr:Retrovirus-related Pol polyprotein from transposon TNT 1-94 [Gossypium australe]